MKTTHRLIAAAALAACSMGAYAEKGETVKIAWIDPLSGLMAPVGSNQLKSFQFFAEKGKNPLFFVLFRSPLHSWFYVIILVANAIMAHCLFYLKASIYLNGYNKKAKSHCLSLS